MLEYNLINYYQYTSISFGYYFQSNFRAIKLIHEVIFNTPKFIDHINLLNYEKNYLLQDLQSTFIQAHC